MAAFSSEAYLVGSANSARRSAQGTAVTMEDVARLAGVSTATVSRALQGDPRVKSGTQERIVALANKHGYAVNSNARKLRQKRSNTIAVVIHLPPDTTPQWSGPFVFQLMADVANGLWLRHQDLLLCSPEGNQRGAYQSIVASKGADGIIFLGQGPNDQWLRELARTRAPFVVWGAVEDRPRYCTVGSDNLSGGRHVGERFIGLGRRRILFLGNRDHPEMKQRWEGLLHALRDKGSSVTLDYAQVPDFSFEAALKSVTAYFAGHKDAIPDAIFSGSDEIARAAIMAAQDIGLKIPEDVSIIGYDDAPIAAHMRPRLTTVRQDTRVAASILVEKLFQIVDGGRPASTMIPAELIVRET
jgi:DNA-binding LacI/PurR family transcriptional regulator